MISPPRRKILVAAYACEPDKGSEPGVGWNWVQLISQNNDVWVLTRENNRPGIERELTIRPNPHLHFEYVDLPRSLRFWKKGGRGIRTYYYLWQFAALKRARKIHARVTFDFGHHISFVNDWLWTLFALMPLPYIWGPIGSNPKLPSDLLPDTRARLSDTFRCFVQTFMRWFDPLFWLSAFRASAVLVISPENASRIPLKWIAGRKLIVEPAIGIEQVPETPAKHSNQYFDVLFMGQFIPIKAPHLAVEAFAKAAQEIKNARLTIVGNGPEELNIRRRIKFHKISEKVTILPWLPRENALALMRKTDTFLFPSMEGAGMVVLEAMAAGKPVVCLNFGGPGAMVTGKTGIKVKVGPKRQVVDELAEALQKLANNPAERRAMGLTAMDEARRRFIWTAKLGRIQTIYESLH